MTLTSQQRDEIIEALLNGDDVPEKYRLLLFPPQRRECELVYEGKLFAEEVIGQTMPVPLQEARTFNPNGHNWHNMLIFGDNLQILARLREMKLSGELCNADGSPGVRLIYIDPPFATRQEFSSSRDQKAYSDKKAGARFIEALRQRLIMMREVMTDDGFLILHTDYRYGHSLKLVLDEIFMGGFKNEVIVRRGTKNVQNQFEEISALAVGNDNLMVYSKQSQTKMPHLRVELDEQNPGKWDTFWRGTDRPTMRYKLFNQHPQNGQWRWKESRAKEAVDNYKAYLKRFSAEETLDQYYLRILQEEGEELGFVRLNEEGVVQYYVPPQDAFLANTLWTSVRTAGKVTGYPTEKHEELLWRMIDWLSRPGDIVLDAFCGSGTTCAVAEKSGRRWIGIDTGKLAIYTTQKRLLNLKDEIGNKGKSLRAKSFTLFNGGLYDFNTLKREPRETWRFFALQLFECSSKPHRIGGVLVDGTRRGAPVLVWNHHEKPGRIDESTIEELHRELRGKVDGKFFVIAPRGLIDFQQDYIELEGVRYYMLRIPYNFIAELHQRGFSPLRQANDAKAINDLIESAGFYFIVPPRIEFECGLEAPPGRLLPEAYVRISEFESQAKRGAPANSAMDTLALLMFDYNYDTEGKIFDLDEAFTPAQLEKTESGTLTARITPGLIGQQVMALFVDIYGNESQVLIPRVRFGLDEETVMPAAASNRSRRKTT